MWIRKKSWLGPIVVMFVLFAEVRRFGLTVGGTVRLLGVLSRTRGHSVPALVLLTPGELLVAPARVVPGVLGPVKRVWMGAARALGRSTAGSS